MVSKLIDELTDRYHDLGAAHLRRVIEDALHDLSGSVHPEDLPEMAIRLVMLRLADSTAGVAA